MEITASGYAILQILGSPVLLDDFNKNL